MTLKFTNVSYEYAPNSPFAHHALKDINLSIEMGKITAIIGATGSGKSTLVQLLNGLLRPTQGSVHVLNTEIVAQSKPKNLKALRAKVGLVFQFPEMQLFEESIYKDVSFGPKNFGFNDDEIKENVEIALNRVGIAESLWQRSPLDVSGGQKRRVAIAGVLATEPDVLVLDEPTAGLDPQGAKAMMRMFESLNRDHGKTIIMVTHDMDHVLNTADNVVVLDQGSVVYSGEAKSLFTTSTILSDLGFVAPKMIQLKALLDAKGFNTDGLYDFESIVSVIKEHRHE